MTKRAFACLIIAATVLAGCARPTQDPSVKAPAADTPSQPAAPQPTAPAPPVRAEPPALYPANVVEQGRTKWGYIDRSGKFAIAPAFDSAEEFQRDGTALVYSGGKAGLIDRTGKFLIQPVYDYASQPSPAGERVFAGQGDNLVAGPGGQVLFASPEASAIAASGLVTVQRGNLYGIADTAGKLIIEPQFEWIDAFAGGKALATVKRGHYVLIETTGKRLAEYFYPTVSAPSDGLLAFADGRQKWGYLLESGEVAIPAQFGQAQRFEDRLAVVNAGDWSNARFGVINQKGEFVIPAQYGAIRYFGSGLYAVAKEYNPSVLSIPKALFNHEGRQLTDFVYYDMEKGGDGLVSVTDETSTFLLDRTGNRANGLPVLAGFGTMHVTAGDLIRAQIDRTLTYLTRDGKIIWQFDRNVALGGGLVVKAQKYRPNRAVLIYYPVLSGLTDQQVQDRINSQLRTAFAVPDAPQSPAPSGAQGFQTSIDRTFTAMKLGKLVIINLDGYDYPAGAAHGMPLDNHYHFDLATGAQYGLADLFKPGSKYTERLTNFVRAQVAKKPQEYLNKQPEVQPGQPFIIEPDGLVIYYYPYEIAAYAFGFPRFKLPWSELADLINQEGAFWQSFRSGVKG